MLTVLRSERDRCWRGGHAADWLLIFATLTTIFALFSRATIWAQATAASNTERQDRSHRIHEILQEAKSYTPADTKTRLAFEEITQREINSFVDFEEQCNDLQDNLTENDAMEKRKRHMLTELRYEFRDEPQVQPFFKLLGQMEDLTDKSEPVWRGMIACERILESSSQSKQKEYQTICINPAKQQLIIQKPELDGLLREFQDYLQKYGETLPRDLLQALGQ
jgi:hypothetical protein